MRLLIMYSGKGTNAKHIKANIDTEIYFITNNKIEIDYTNKVSDDTSLEYYMKKINPDLVVLAGWNKMIPTHLTEQFTIINQHPSLLPIGKGLYGRKCLEASFNEVEYGISYHYVNEELDGGKMIKQFKATTPQTYDQFLIDEKALEHSSFIEVINSLI